MKFKIIDLYIAKKFIGAVVFTLLLTAVISSIFDISEKLDNMIQNGVTLKIALVYYLSFIPNIINLTSPMLIFIASLFFTARLANDTEFVALLSSGVSYYRLLLPYIVVGLMLTGTDLIMKNYLVPYAYRNVLAFELKYVQVRYDNDARNIHKQLDNNSFFYIHDVDLNNNIVHLLSIEKFDKQKLIYKLNAQEARMDTVHNNWHLHNYYTRTFDGMHEHITRGDSMILKLPITKEDFTQKVRASPAMTTPQLSKFIEEESFKGENLNNFYLIEKYRRQSYPFAIFVLVMISVAIATRKVRGGIGAHIMIGILIAISFELFMRFSTTFSTNGNLPPLISVWIPNFFYSCVAVYLLYKTPK